VSRYLAIAVAAILGVAAYSTARPTLDFLRAAQPAHAQVGGIHPCKDRPPPGGRRSRLDGIAECADVQFRSMGGREIQGMVRGWPGRATKGETIDVLYDPESPERHGRDGVLDLWWGPGLLGMAAALVLLRGTVGMGRS